jgi:hypothetical protein
MPVVSNKGEQAIAKSVFSVSKFPTDINLRDSGTSNRDVISHFSIKFYFRLFK